VNAIQWWNEIQDVTDTPISELVDGLDEIAAQAIPYARLPGRARTVFAAELSTWSDLADETIASLTSRSKIGVSTVRAMLVAARDTVATARSLAADDDVDAPTAIHRLLDRLSNRDRSLLSLRGWALQPLTTREIARRLGVADVNVDRNQPRAYARFQELLAEPVHAPVRNYAQQLRQRLGPLTREHAAEIALKDLGLDLGTDSGQLLVHVAGPYAPRQSWLEDTSTDGLDSASAILDAALDHWGAPTVAVLIRELARIGMPSDTAIDFIESRPGLRSFGERWVRWGASIADKAEAVLHASGGPASADLIAAALDRDYQPRAVRAVLFEDDRFARATKETWALRKWGLDEYAGIFAEIASRIDSAGGAISVKVIVDDIKAAFPDVAESSIRTYLSRPAFIVRNGVVRRRTEDDGWPTFGPLQLIRGAFYHGDNEIRIALPVNGDMLRGSGQNLHPAVAGVLGVQPGQQRTFAGTLADITLVWRLSSTKGPTVGSLRTLAASLDAGHGDTLVLAFNMRDETVAATRIPLSHDDPRQRLRLLLGASVRSPKLAIARALRCEPQEVPKLLRRRGDTELIDITAALEQLAAAPAEDRAEAWR